MVSDYELSQRIEERIKSIKTRIIDDYNQDRSIDNKDDMFH